MKKFYTLLVFAENRRGVLERITMLIRKKMYNLEQITASDTERDNIKRLTISFSSSEAAKIPQIIVQLKNILEIKDVKLINPENAIEREVVIIKLYKPKKFTELLSVVNLFEAKIIDLNKDNLIIEFTGLPERIDLFLESLKEFQLLELGRSGAVAIEK